jgi:pimeloyl-ACP methyl ester carboxylesterase
MCVTKMRTHDPTDRFGRTGTHKGFLSFGFYIVSALDVRTEALVVGARSLDVLVGGAADGPALILHHGTPSDATTWRDWDETARAHGLRLLSISRPGYATSTRRPGRTVADVADDVAFAVERYGVPWFVTAGWSGGGPHALATAALLGERCRAVATLAGVGPYGVAGLDFLAGMGPENHAEFGAALRGETALRDWLAEHAADYPTVTGAQIVDALGGLIAHVDKDVLSGGIAEAFAATTRRALSGGFDGWIDDDLAFIEPWGFSLASIDVPVTVWQGDLDLMVPAAHGAWLAAAVPGAVARAAPGHGHISLVTTFRDAIVEDLLGRE